jgi:hypothetical protein
VRLPQDVRSFAATKDALKIQQDVLEDVLGGYWTKQSRRNPCGSRRLNWYRIVPAQ